MNKKWNLQGLFIETTGQNRNFLRSGMEFEKIFDIYFDIKIISF